MRRSCIISTEYKDISVGRPNDFAKQEIHEIRHTLGSSSSVVALCVQSYYSIQRPILSALQGYLLTLKVPLQLSDQHSLEMKPHFYEG